MHFTAIFGINDIYWKIKKYYCKYQCNRSAPKSVAKVDKFNCNFVYYYLISINDFDWVQ